jgi:uncharacterized protein (UPF0261 family)
MGGFSELDYPGQPFWCPEANQAFLDELGKVCVQIFLSK